MLLQQLLSVSDYQYIYICLSAKEYDACLPTTYLVSKCNYITIQKHVLCYYKCYFCLAKIQLGILHVLANCYF